LEQRFGVAGGEGDGEGSAVRPSLFQASVKNFGIGVVKAGRGGSQRIEKVAERINPMLQPIEKKQ